VGDRYIIVGDENNSGDSGNLYQLVHKKWMTDIKQDLVEKVEGDSFLTVGMGENSNGGNYFVDVEKDCQECIGGNRDLKVKGSRNEEVANQYSMTLGQLDIAVNKAAAMEVTESLHIKAMNIVIEADMQLSLKVGGNFVDISVAGVAINGMPMTLINSGGMAGVGLGAHPVSPKEPDHLDASRPKISMFKKADDAKTGSKSCD
jgi:type VI secretion system secreted protein VgrG